MPVAARNAARRSRLAQLLALPAPRFFGAPPSGSARRSSPLRAIDGEAPRPPFNRPSGGRPLARPTGFFYGTGYHVAHD